MNKGHLGKGFTRLWDENKAKSSCEVILKCLVRNLTYFNLMVGPYYNTARKKSGIGSAPVVIYIIILYIIVDFHY